jgi:hypothetical protein
MRASIKLNRKGWPSEAARFLPVADDPRVLVGPGARALSATAFAQAVSVFKFGTTFKTTNPGRQPIADRLVAERFAGERPVILDIGASDGSTSLDLIRRLGDGFARYYVTDYNIAVQHAVASGATFFRDVGGSVILVVSDHFVAYADTDGALPPLGWASRRAVSRAPTVAHWAEIKLVQPQLLELQRVDPRIFVERYDMTRPWEGPRPDLVRIANVLNGVYFSDDQIRSVLRIQCARLGEGGLLLLGDNRDAGERLSLLQRRGNSMVLEVAHGGGAEAARHAPQSL